MAVIRTIAGLLTIILFPIMPSHASEPPTDETVYDCHRLPQEESSSWPEQQHVLAKRKLLPLVQNWLATTDPLFAPANAAAAWDDNYLYVYADLEDQDIFNPSKGLNQPAYQKGDIFEILIRSRESEAYFEFHVTPHDEVMQLRFPHKASLAEYREAGGKPENLISTFQIDERVVETHAEIRPEENRWTVLLKIPAKVIMPNRAFHAGDVLLFSFCRYDHTRGTAAPVLSSTSHYTVCSFHRQEEWRKMTLVP